MSKSDRLKRLQRLKGLGVKKGIDHIKIPSPKPLPTEIESETERIPLHFLNYEEDLQNPVPIETVIGGQIIQNEHGQYFNFEARYPLDAAYGHQPLRTMLNIPMQAIATITGDEAWLNLTWEKVLFIDTETTGLEIAAGTVAFLIGVGYLDGNDFVVRQVFMRDFDEETALLYDLYTLCEKFEAIASFNGKTFDVPLLENRFIMARLFPDLFEGPHLDLLHPARRLWRRRLENCKLSTLETDILGLNRTQADVPGYFIPTLYRKYLVDHDARVLAGIFYHNELDIVSMSALAAILGQTIAYPAYPIPTDPIDLISLGLWQINLDQPVPAEQALKQAIEQNLDTEWQQLAHTQLAYLLKRQNRLIEAETLWQQLATLPDNLLALEELAKYYEWHQKAFAKALTCIDYALKTIQTQPHNWEQQDTLAKWEHRRQRVAQKAEKNNRLVRKQEIDLPKKG